MLMIAYNTTRLVPNPLILSVYFFNVLSIYTLSRLASLPRPVHTCSALLCHALYPAKAQFVSLFDPALVSTLPGSI